MLNILSMFQYKWCAIFLSSLQATGKAGKNASDRKTFFVNRS